MRIQVGEGIVGEPRKMNYGIKPFQVRMLDVTEVLSNGRKFTRRLAKSALFEKITVEPKDFVTCVSDQRRHNRADITFMSGQQYSHSLAALFQKHPILGLVQKMRVPLHPSFYFLLETRPLMKPLLLPT